MRTKTIPASLIALAVTLSLLVAGCGNTPASAGIPPDPFATSWNLGEEGRTFSISGDSAGHRAGETSEFLLKMDNSSGEEPWRGEYCVLLLDRDGIVKAVASGQYDVPVGGGTQRPILVEFPEGYKGPLGLCIVIPERASVVTTVWVGTDRSGSAGPWPSITTCP